VAAEDSGLRRYRLAANWSGGRRGKLRVEHSTRVLFAASRRNTGVRPRCGNQRADYGALRHSLPRVAKGSTRVECSTRP